MKLPLSWLTAHVDLDLDVDALVHVMSMHGLEVEEVARPGASTGGVRVARVLAHRPHPDAERLRVVHVTGADGDGEVELVCGADNFDVGDLVLHAPVGASIPGMTMEARAIRGVVSNGMLCSPRELQLGDDHTGILVLTEDHPPGTDLTDIIPIGEPVIEIAVQADRGDHLGIVGVARDLAAILDTTWHLPQAPRGPGEALVPVSLDTERCARFATWSLDDVTVGPSPLWMRQRLAQCGIRSIDVVVDVTNLVMLETGQPLHAFDLATLRGRELRVREARAGELITTLDDVERDLAEGDVVIEDRERLASLAGVMGGRDTEVSAGTREVLVEAAVWDPATIRATSRRLSLVSEASVRYERRVDPAGAELAAARAAGLLVDLAGARATGSDVVAHDPLPTWARSTTVDVDTDRVRALLGVEELDARTQQVLLERSGCDVQPGDGPTDLRVTSPTWRGDLRRPADLAEEVIRLHGYDRVPAVLPSVRQSGGLSPAQRLERGAREAALAQGFTEAVIRPFVGDGALVGVQLSDGRVRLANPLARDAAAMRPSLVEGLLGAVRRNVGQGRAGTALVELGRVFRPVDDPLADALDALGAPWRWTGPAGEPLPAQPRAMGLVAQGIVVGERWLDPGRTWSVHDVLAVFDEVARRLSDPASPALLVREPVEREGFHPGRSVRLLLEGQEIGFVGQLHPTEADTRDLPEPVVVGELVTEALLARVPPEGHGPALAPLIVRHPAMVVDVALVADDAIGYDVLEQAVVDGAGALLDACWWFDEYRGEQLGDGRRSVGIRLRLQDPERQLTDEDAEAVIAEVGRRAEAVGASLRR